MFAVKQERQPIPMAHPMDTIALSIGNLVQFADPQVHHHIITLPIVAIPLVIPADTKEPLHTPTTTIATPIAMFAVKQEAQNTFTMTSKMRSVMFATRRER